MLRPLRHLLWIGVLALTLAACASPQPYADDATIAAVSYRDPGPAEIRLYTMVNNRSGAGAHSSLMINANERIIFDPAGSFKADIVPERNDVLFGITPQVEQAYRGAHARSTFHVVIQTIKVTPEQAQLAYQIARQYGGVAGGFCANATSNILRQIPGFEDIRVTMFPVNLQEQLEGRAGVTTERYYEDDSADLAEGLAKSNAALNQ